jgi:hypothetical protein
LIAAKTRALAQDNFYEEQDDRKSTTQHVTR